LPADTTSCGSAVWPLFLVQAAIAPVAGPAVLFVVARVYHKL
jgi:hypothetical protein